MMRYSVAMPENFVDGEDDDDDDDDEIKAITQHTVLPDGQELFLTLTEILSQGGILNHEAAEGTSAADVSSLPPPSQRLSQIRWQKNHMCDEMVSELLLASHTERAQQKVWKDTIAQDRKAASEREERWQQEDQRMQDATLGLLQEQTGMVQHLVEVQERQLERLRLQPLFNHPSPSPTSIAASSPRHPRGGSGHPTTPPQWTEDCHSTSTEVAFSFPPPQPHPGYFVSYLRIFIIK
ncbi:uncharacterized protein LOC127050023 [Gopherus flavomarginatus]|uniref:uncharacterized protein LOC127050023 n=1 Tax=Gopherus flavomarginatus TaxID=286002 RepID=UPI0021CC47C0|nr:uncharacterized protein LOC127050023 [Gopherus flavomarginatus]